MSSFALAACLVLSTVGPQGGDSAVPAGLVGSTTQYLFHAGERVPYALYVPHTPRPASGFPLLLALHGGGDDHTKFFTGYDHGALLRAAEAAGMVVAAPRTQPYGGYGEAEQGEVLAVRTDVLRLMSIDPDRIYLFGHSMGGQGALEIASAYPTGFAAVASFAGPLDSRRAAQLSGFPVYIAHGDRDQVISVEASRRMVQVLAENGVPIQYHEIAGADHNSHVAREMLAMLQWLATHRRPQP